MEKQTANKVKKLIKLYEITSPDDERIEGIADLFTDEYIDEQSFVAFQKEISEIVGK